MTSAISFELSYSSITATSSTSSSGEFTPDECVADLPSWFDETTNASSLTSSGLHIDTYTYHYAGTTITSSSSATSTWSWSYYDYLLGISDGGTDQYDFGNAYLVNNIPVTDWAGWDTKTGAMPSTQVVGGIDVFQHFQWGEGEIYDTLLTIFHRNVILNFVYNFNASIAESFTGPFDSRIVSTSVTRSTTTSYTTTTLDPTPFDSASLGGLFFGTVGAVNKDTSITITGWLGADSAGEVVAVSYVYSSAYGFRKTICGAEDSTSGEYDPAIHHLWITSDPAAAHRYSLDTDQDFDRVWIHAGHYLVVVTYFSSSDYCIDEDDAHTAFFQALVDFGVNNLVEDCASSTTTTSTSTTTTTTTTTTTDFSGAFTAALSAVSFFAAVAL